MLKSRNRITNYLFNKIFNRGYKVSKEWLNDHNRKIAENKIKGDKDVIKER